MIAGLDNQIFFPPSAKLKIPKNGDTDSANPTFATEAC
jgi:hypothetical protein